MNEPTYGTMQNFERDMTIEEIVKRWPDQVARDLKELARVREINTQMLIALRELTNVVDGSLRELMQTGNYHHGVQAPVLRAAYDAIDKAEGRRPREFKSL